MHEYRVAVVTSFGHGDIVGLRDAQVKDRIKSLQHIEDIGNVDGPETTTNGKPIKQKVALYKVINIIHLKGGETLYSKSDVKTDNEEYLKLELDEARERINELEAGAKLDQELIIERNQEIAKLKLELEKLKPNKK